MVMTEKNELRVDDLAAFDNVPVAGSGWFRG